MEKISNWVWVTAKIALGYAIYYFSQIRLKLTQRWVYTEQL